jgi:hypothetical protein
VFETRRRGGVAAEHAGELGDPVVVGNLTGCGHGPPVPQPLLDHVVDVRERGELGQMRDAEDLPGPPADTRRQPGELLPHGHGRRTSDPGVHLIEDEHAGLIDVGERDLHRERDT